MSINTKVCIKCGKEKSTSLFSPSTRGSGLRKCKACYIAEASFRRKDNPQKAKHQDRTADLKRRWSLTPADYQVMLKAQDSVCAICDKTARQNGRRLAVDHCHATGRIRELLCTRCNRLLGHAQDNMAHIRAAIRYLEQKPQGLPEDTHQHGAWHLLPESIRRKRRKKHEALWTAYRISIEQYEALSQRQHDKCGICGHQQPKTSSLKHRSLAVDHCHETNQIRGLLCTRCNRGIIGHAQDDLEVLRSALVYIQKHQGQAQL